MRTLVDADKVRRVLDALGRQSRGAGRVYLTGGATAVLHGWRGSTVDLDLKLDPEPEGAFAAIRDIKENLDVNIELAAPDAFIPALPGWRERSIHIARHGEVDFYHYDPYAQALAKIERGHARDLDDVAAMVDRGLVELERLDELFERIVPDLERYPRIDADAFRDKLTAFIASRVNV